MLLFTYSKDDGKAVKKNWILASAFSKSGTFFAVCDDQKQLHVYRTTPKWELLSTRQVARRCTAVTFTNSESHVIVADRPGDVYRFATEDDGKEGELILGHLSMLLDVIITKDDRYIITCDRDEKIRISHYPNAYNIHTFCLRHTEFVSQLLYIDKLDCLLSCSGDGTICSWNLVGKLLHCVNCKRKSSYESSQMDSPTNGEGDTEVKGHVEETRNTDISAVKKMAYDDHLNILAVIYFNSPSISFFTLLHHESGIQLQELDHTTDTSCCKELWDIGFDNDHRLWLLQARQEQTVIVCRCLQDGNQLQVKDVSNEEGVSGIVTKLNSSWDFFSESLSAPGLYSVLQKTKVDNMKEYMERKNERISGKKLKQGGINEDRQNEPLDKKMKVS